MRTKRIICGKRIYWNGPVLMTLFSFGCSKCAVILHKKFLIKELEQYKNRRG